MRRSAIFTWLFRYRYSVVAVGLIIIAVISGWLSWQHRQFTQNLQFSVAGVASSTKTAELPLNQTCDGSKLSPPLEITKLPDGTKSLAIFFRDRKPSRARSQLYNHYWLSFNVPTDIQKVPEGIRPAGTITRNLEGEFAYAAPCPTNNGSSEYLFTLYALNAPTLTINSQATEQEFLDAIKGKIITEQTISFHYQKK